MQNGHKTYTKEFKEEAASLSRWCQKWNTHGEQAFPGSGHQLPEQEEVRRLKRELEVVRMERDILKKAVAIFSHL